MNILEIVHLRLAGEDPESLVGLIREVTAAEPSETEVRIYRNAKLETDIVIHFHREEEEGEGGTSESGLRLASILRRHGIVEHSLWRKA